MKLKTAGGEGAERASPKRSIGNPESPPIKASVSLSGTKAILSPETLGTTLFVRLDGAKSKEITNVRIHIWDWTFEATESTLVARYKNMPLYIEGGEVFKK